MARSNESQRRRFKGRTPAQRVALHATFVLDVWHEKPSIGYGELVEKVRAHFECGHASAEQAIKYARDILRERAADPSVADKIAEAYWNIYEDALKHGDRLNARRTLDSLRAHFGVGAPARVNHSGTVALDLEKLSDDELAEAAGMPRSVLERALHRASSNGHTRSGGQVDGGDGN